MKKSNPVKKSSKLCYIEKGELCRDDYDELFERISKILMQGPKTAYELGVMLGFNSFQIASICKKYLLRGDLWFSMSKQKDLRTLYKGNGRIRLYHLAEDHERRLKQSARPLSQEPPAQPEPDSILIGQNDLIGQDDEHDQWMAEWSQRARKNLWLRHFVVKNSQQSR